MGSFYLAPCVCCHFNPRSALNRNRAYYLCLSSRVTVVLNSQADANVAGLPIGYHGSHLAVLIGYSIAVSNVDDSHLQRSLHSVRSGINVVNYRIHPHVIMESSHTRTSDIVTDCNAGTEERLLWSFLEDIERMAGYCWKSQ